MAKTLLLEAELREHTGSKHAERTRLLHRIPAVIYGHKQQPLSISLNEHDFVEGLHHGHRLMNIKIDNKKETVIVKDMQYDYLGKKVIHVDLVRVSVSERVKVTVPIELKGIAKGTHESGIIEEHADSIEIECPASEIPETVVVSVKDVGVGESLHASDIQLPANATLLTEKSTVIVTCSLVAAAKAAEATELEEEEAEVAEPEVIGKKKEQEDETGSEGKKK